MRRISPADLRNTIYVAIRTAPRTIKRKLVSKLPHEGDEATGKLTDLIVDKAFGGVRRMIEPDHRNSSWDNSGTTGKWGPDDPDPTEGL